MSRDLQIPVKKRRITLTNLLPNISDMTFMLNKGDVVCEMSAAHTKYSSKTLCITSPAGDDEEYGVTIETFSLIPDHIYYACVEVYQEKQLGSVDFFWPDSSPSVFGGETTGTAGQWNKYSRVSTDRWRHTAGEHRFRLDFNNSGVVGKAWFDGAMIIDLTEAFGSGKEPGNDWCRKNIPYFTGSYYIFEYFDTPKYMSVENLDISEIPGVAENVTEITDESGRVLWKKKNAPEPPKPEKINYVSFGDSIAAGHLINSDWKAAPYYGGGTQYGGTYLVTGSSETERDENLTKFNNDPANKSFLENSVGRGYGSYPDGYGRTIYYYAYEWKLTTKMVEGCYTDLMRNALNKYYGDDNVTATSFARSGSRVQNNVHDGRSLIDVLDKDIVEQTLSQADVVTISIGANDILEPAVDYFVPFVTGETDLSDLEAVVNNNLKTLDDEYDENGTLIREGLYTQLFKKMTKINPDAKYVFCTIYNPYKYFHLERSTLENEYNDGFLGPWLERIPSDTNIIIPDLTAIAIKAAIVNSDFLNGCIDRANYVSSWAEERIRDLNDVMVGRINAYNERLSSPRFFVAETHDLFDTVPDRDSKSYLHYNDLVNCQITKNFDGNMLPWVELWGDGSNDPADEQIKRYWTALIKKYKDNLAGIADEIMPIIVDKVIYEAMDVHPRADGHYAMYRAFADVLNRTSAEDSKLKKLPLLKTITYNANGGSGTMTEQKAMEKSVAKLKNEKTGEYEIVERSVLSIISPNKFSYRSGYHHNGWNTKANGSGTHYENTEANDDNTTYRSVSLIQVLEDVTLYAQWDNKYNLTIVQSANGDDPNVVSSSLNFANLLGEDYSRRKLDINQTTYQLHDDKRLWSKGTVDYHTIRVAYGDIVEMTIQGRLGTQLGLGELPNCTMRQLSSETEWGIEKTGKTVIGQFQMPDRDITIEYYFNYVPNAVLRYEHRWWNGYIGDPWLDVNYTVYKQGEEN
jgi:lysophospholipase L1-like esterase